MGKYAIVHVDLIDGLASKSIAADFIKQYTDADGIISTKPALIDRANQIGLFTVQRFFMMDGITYANITRYVKQNDPDVVELMPSGLSKLIKYLVELISQPVVASGLTQDSEDIIRALSAGAVGVATSNKELWQC
jgi:glycerol uptake operon antiterminator